MGPKLFWGPPGGPLPLPAKGRPFASAGAFFSISPEILKPIRRECRVANRRSNRPVAKIVLDRSGVPPIQRHRASTIAQGRGHLVTSSLQGRVGDRTDSYSRIWQDGGANPAATHLLRCGPQPRREWPLRQGF